MPSVLCNVRYGLLWCFSTCDILWYRVKWFMVSTTDVCIWVEQISCITAHWAVRVPLFSLSPCLGLLFYWMLLWPMVNQCVHFCKAPKQFSSDLISSDTSSRLRSMHLFWSLARSWIISCLVRFILFAMFRFHVIFLIWCIISGSCLPRNIYFDAGYRLSNRTDSGRTAQRRCLDRISIT